MLERRTFRSDCGRWERRVLNQGVTLWLEDWRDEESDLEVPVGIYAIGTVPSPPRQRMTDALDGTICTLQLSKSGGGIFVWADNTRRPNVKKTHKHTHERTPRENKKVGWGEDRFRGTHETLMIHTKGDKSEGNPNQGGGGRPATTNYCGSQRGGKKGPAGHRAESTTNPSRHVPQRKNTRETCPECFFGRSLLAERGESKRPMPRFSRG